MNPTEEQAARWLARLELGLMKGSERREFECWEAAPENALALREMRDVLAQAQTAASEPGIMKMRAETLANIRRGPLLLGNVPVGIAAAAVGVLILAGLTWRTPDAEHPMPSDVYSTGKGEQRAVALADGSVLRLNTDSRAEVEFAAKGRRVRLLKGQAWFKVAPDKNRPFTVAAGELEVLALGTAFDVRVDGGRAKVVLVEGRIRVEPLTHRGMARLLPNMDRQYLQPGQQIADGANGLHVATADIEQSTGWQQGRLVFRGESLSSAITEFNRYNARQLVIEDAALEQLPVSGVFSSVRPENFLAAVASFYPVSVEERSANLTVLTFKK